MTLIDSSIPAQVLSDLEWALEEDCGKGVTIRKAHFPIDDDRDTLIVSVNVGDEARWGHYDIDEKVIDWMG